jgi:type III restriction enzyme
MAGSKQAHLFRNPEGFATVFSTTIRGALADHILDRIEFLLPGDRADQDLDHLFPGSQEFPQKELVPAGAHALYDQVQTDSDAEARFVRERLVPDDRVICYFKFPAKFCIPLPQIIGNYNPDWGILRYDEAGRVVLQLVRETKGSEELRSLQFPHERRKVLAAREHFRALGLDYRVITDQTPAWWLPSDELPAQPDLGHPRSP